MCARTIESDLAWRCRHTAFRSMINLPAVSTPSRSRSASAYLPETTACAEPSASSPSQEVYNLRRPSSSINAPRTRTGQDTDEQYNALFKRASPQNYPVSVLNDSRRATKAILTNISARSHQQRLPTTVAASRQSDEHQPLWLSDRILWLFCAHHRLLICQYLHDLRGFFSAISLGISPISTPVHYIDIPSVLSANFYISLHCATPSRQ